MLAGPAEAAARAVSGRRAQQAAVGVFDPARADRGIPRRGGFAAGAGRRVRLRPAVPVRADRNEAAARRPQRPAPVPLRRHLVHGSQEGADRALPVRFRARRAFDTLALARDGATIAAAARRREPGPIVSDHTPEEYMANVETVREGMRRGDYYEVVLRQTFRTPYSGKAVGPVRARAAGQPEPVRIPAAVRR